MAFRLYITPSEGDPFSEQGAHPKYFSALPGWTGMYYGFQPVYLVRFCTDYLREHLPGFYQQPQQHYEERMDQLEWARTALLKLVKKEQE